MNVLFNLKRAFNFFFFSVRHSDLRLFSILASKSWYESTLVS